MMEEQQQEEKGKRPPSSLSAEEAQQQQQPQISKAALAARERRARLTRVSSSEMAAAGSTLRELARLRSRRARLNVLGRTPLESLRTLSKIVASVVFMQVPDVLTSSTGRRAVRAMMASPRYKSMKRAVASRKAFARMLDTYSEPSQYLDLLRPFASHMGVLLSAALGLPTNQDDEKGGHGRQQQGQGTRQELAAGSQVGSRGGGNGQKEGQRNDASASSDDADDPGGDGGGPSRMALGGGGGESPAGGGGGGDGEL